MKKRPDHLDQRELAHVLSEQWGLAPRDFRGPHEQNEDTGLMWETLTGEIEEIRRFAR